jgi:dihydroneopterin aldolase
MSSLLSSFRSFARSYHVSSFSLSPLSVGSQAAASSSAAVLKSPPSSFPPLVSLPRDRIYLKGLVFHAYHGFHPPERVLGQKFIFDVTLFTSLKAAGQSGDLNDSIDYSQVYTSIERLVTESAPFLLLEQLGEVVAREIFHQYKNPSLVALQLCIKKPHVAVHGVLDYFAIEIFRTRQEFESAGNEINQQTEYNEVKQ